jgi:hypothetical protein
MIAVAIELLTFVVLRSGLKGRFDFFKTVHFPAYKVLDAVGWQDVSLGTLAVMQGLLWVIFLFAAFWVGNALVELRRRRRSIAEHAGFKK